MAISPPNQVITLNISGTPTDFYYHGWQSWSLATWVPTGISLMVPLPAILHPMQYHPATVGQFGKVSHWVGAIRTEDGEVTLLGGLGIDCTVEWDGKALIGKYHGQDPHGIRWFFATGNELQVFDDYAKSLMAISGFQKGIPAHPLRIWCSWYSHYTHITEQKLLADIAGLDGLAFDVIQVDDGWQMDIGDWVENKKFPSGLPNLSNMITKTGRKAGLWLAPLIASESSALYKDHSDWFVKTANGKPISAGFNWGKRLFALDLSHPEAIAWLSETLLRIQNMGFAYLKLDFLYAGALPGQRHLPMSGEEAYRAGLRQALSVLSQSTFILFCGAPLIASAGLCHAMRIGPDVAPQWESERDAILLANPAIPGVRNAIRTCHARLWQSSLYRLDPDVAYFASAHHELTKPQAALLLELCLKTRTLATSDRPEWLTPFERAELSAFLTTFKDEDGWDPAAPVSMQVPKEALDLPLPPTSVRSLLRLALGFIANLPLTHIVLKSFDDHLHRD